MRDPFLDAYMNSYPQLFDKKKKNIYDESRNAAATDGRASRRLSLL